MGRHSKKAVQNTKMYKVTEITEKLKKFPTPQVSRMESVREVCSALNLNSELTPSPSYLESYCANISRKLHSSVFSKHLHLHIPINRPSKSNIYCMFALLLAVTFYFELHTPKGFTKLWLSWEDVDVKSVECTVQQANVAMELFRPSLPCEFCQHVESADRVSNITPSNFEEKYAYSGRPVVITDAMTNWTAPSAFSFDFLKSIYGIGSRSLAHEGENCLFFPYATEFQSLGEVFNMSQSRFNQRWYIGWSNCDAEASDILRSQYSRPYFLPVTAESTHADWIFMGTPGYGAHMHIDHVFLPSWQAQIAGTKRWFLQPPPECYFQCQSFSVDVNPGDIIVLDTNKWYHQTQILPSQMSITIGSEYD